MTNVHYSPSLFQLTINVYSSFQMCPSKRKSPCLIYFSYLLLNKNQLISPSASHQITYLASSLESMVDIYYSSNFGMNLH